MSAAGVMRDRCCWWLHAGFFTCGFHTAVLVTHMPDKAGLCGLNAGIREAPVSSSRVAA